MPQNLVIANFTTGYENDRQPFLIDNDAFPVINNAYLFRGRVLRKQGSKLLGRLQRDLTAQALGTTDGAGGFSGNIITILTLEATAQIVEGSITITVGAETFTEPATPNGTLVGSLGGTGTINYSTGDITLTGAPALTAVTIDFSYYPSLPVMGLEDFVRAADFPRLVAFDTRYSYEIVQTTETFYDVTFYQFTGQPFTWNGADYQQFFSAQYHNALWVTNGVPGFHFITILDVVPGAISTITTTAAHNLTNEDRVFLNQISGITNINGVSGQVTVTGANTFTISTPGALGVYGGGGIVQYLTRSSSTTIDGIRYYTGDPTVAIPPTAGWVNFAPPLDNTLTPNYLIGADIVVPFKDRLLFFGVTIGTSAAPAGQYFPNRMVYSQNGTPYYTLVVPDTETFQFQAWFQNVPARGGFLGAPVQQEIVTVIAEEDVLIVGFENSHRKIIYTADDSFPFIYQTISAEFGASHTFSGISLEGAVLFIGYQGIALCTTTDLRRIDEKIPDEVFQISFFDNDEKRVTAIRDFRNQFVYFTVPLKQQETTANLKRKFPSKTLLFNYRENNWATLDENYTHYGYYRTSVEYTWATLPYATWSDWTKPWNYGGQGDRFPNIIGGNQQGFVLIKDLNTKEDVSNYIQGVTGVTVTSPNHNMAAGEYIEISGIIGTAGADLNGTIQQIQEVIDRDTFTIETTTAGTYLGGGLFRRILNFDVRTKMFPVFWQEGRKVRLGIQRYLLDTAPDGQVTVDLYVSQVTIFPSNPQIVGFSPYSNILLTGPEPGIILNVAQNQIWHRVSTNVIGDSVQVGFRFSDEQIRDKSINDTQFILNAIAIELYPAGVL